MSECFPAEEYELPPAKAILVHQDKSTFLVESGGTHFLWNNISDFVARIDKPKGLSNLLQVLNDPVKLKTTLLEMPGAAEATSFHPVCFMVSLTLCKEHLEALLLTDFLNKVYINYSGAASRSYC